MTTASAERLKDSLRSRGEKSSRCLSLPARESKDAFLTMGLHGLLFQIPCCCSLLFSGCSRESKLMRLSEPMPLS